MTEQRLRAPVHASDDSYKLEERLMGNQERLVHHAAAQNLSRNPLLLWESRIEVINRMFVSTRDTTDICVFACPASVSIRF